LGGISVPYTAEERATIRAALADGMAARNATERTDRLVAAEKAVTTAHGNALAKALDDVGIVPDVIGWHGQTVAHAPERRFTMQLGDAQDLAARFDRPVVADSRLADVAAGGQGAPLVPAYHRALARSVGLAEPLIVINLGGVANVTFIDGDTLIAFDTGPASAMIDDQMATIGKLYDEGGALAASGTVDQAALSALLDHPYFAAPAPKSLDRDAFSPKPVEGLALADRVATLTAFSAKTIAQGVGLLPSRPVVAVASGGGTHNATLMAAIAAAIGLPVEPADRIGMSSDLMEAEAFAYLAMRTVGGLPITFPGTTGVPDALTGGRLVLPSP
ncbi:MAG: anhydro-N-acetylmuramic acid kinase, partial [Pseudomonadota bacterium]